MAKSLDEIWRDIQQQRQSEIQRHQDSERQIWEQRERARLEYLKQIKAYERVGFTPTSAASAAGAGGGSLPSQVKNTYLLFRFDIPQIVFIEDGVKIPAQNQPFSGETQLSTCRDDNDFIYYVTIDNSDAIFGKMDKATFTRNDILTLDVSTSPSSLLYEGNGNFLYLTPFVITDGDSQIWRINSIGATMSLLQSFDNDSTIPMSLINFNGTLYATSLYSFLTSLQIVNTTLGEGNWSLEPLDYLSMNTQSLPEGLVNTKVWYAFNLIEFGGKILSLVIFTDKDNGVYPYGCIGEINLDDLTINYLLPISDGFSDTYTSLVIY